MGYLLLVSLIWAFSFGLIKNTLTPLDPFLVAFIRMALSLAVFLPVFRPRAIPRGLKWNLAAIGAVQFGLMYVTYIASFRYLKAYEVALFTVFTPLFVSLFSDITDKRFRLRNLLAAMLAACGALVISYRRGQLELFWIGFGLVQLANACFALGQIQYRSVTRQHAAMPASGSFAMLYLGAVAITGLACAAFGKPADLLRIQSDQWLGLVYLGVVASGLGFFWWNLGATRVSAGMLAVLNNLKVPLAVIVSVVVFGERAEILPLAAGIVLFVAALRVAAR